MTAINLPPGPSTPVLPVFNDAASRDAAIPSPVAGQQCITLKANGQPQYLIYRTGTPTGWYPPWNTAWGTIAEAIVTTPQNFGAVTADITNLFLTFAAIPNRMYRYEMELRQHSMNATGLVSWIIADGSNNVIAQNTMGGGNVPIAQYNTRVSTPLQSFAAAQNFTVKGRISSGSTDVRGSQSATQPWTLRVDDVGGA